MYIFGEGKEKSGREDEYGAGQSVLPQTFDV